MLQVQSDMKTVKLTNVDKLDVVRRDSVQGYLNVLEVLMLVDRIANSPKPSGRPRGFVLQNLHERNQLQPVAEVDAQILNLFVG